MEMPTRGSFVYDASSPETFFVRDDPANTVPVKWDDKRVLTKSIQYARTYCETTDQPKPNVYTDCGNTVGETVIYVLKSMKST